MQSKFPSAKLQLRLHKEITNEKHVGNGGVTTCGGIKSDLVISCSLTVEVKSEGFDVLDDFPILETG